LTKDSILKEYQARIAYHYREIDKYNHMISKIKNLEPVNKQTNKQVNTKVLPKGWGSI
jgi:hypothetical protein